MVGHCTDREAAVSAVGRFRRLLSFPSLVERSLNLPTRRSLPALLGNCFSRRFCHLFSITGIDLIR